MMKSVKIKSPKPEHDFELTSVSETKDIVVDGKAVTCASCLAHKFAKASDGEMPYGYPSKPYKFERAIDDTHAYLIDRDGDYWAMHPGIMLRQDARDFVGYISYFEKEDYDFEKLNMARGSLPLFCQEGCAMVRMAL